MKKFILTICIVLMAAGFAPAAYADTLLSEYWNIGGDGAWHVYDANGAMLTDCWLCDDAAGGDVASGTCSWYLIDGSGNVVTSALVTDAYGYYYSLAPDGTGFAALRYMDGRYDGVQMQFNRNAGRGFGAIMNQDAINALQAKYPGAWTARISDPRTVYTSKLESMALSGGAVIVPRSGELYHNQAYLSSSANLTINNSRGTNSYLKIYSANGDLVSTVFVRKGEKVKVYMPGGTYRMKQAFGETWYGEGELFGPEGNYWMCSVNGSYDIPLKRAGVYVLSTTGGGQAITKEELDRASF